MGVKMMKVTGGGVAPTIRRALRPWLGNSLCLRSLPSVIPPPPHLWPQHSWPTATAATTTSGVMCVFFCPLLLWHLSQWWVGDSNPNNTIFVGEWQGSNPKHRSAVTRLVFWRPLASYTIAVDGDTMVPSVIRKKWIALLYFRCVRFCYLVYYKRIISKLYEWL